MLWSVKHSDEHVLFLVLKSEAAQTDIIEEAHGLMIDAEMQTDSEYCDVMLQNSEPQLIKDILNKCNDEDKLASYFDVSVNSIIEQLLLWNSLSLRYLTAFHLSFLLVSQPSNCFERQWLSDRCF